MSMDPELSLIIQALETYRKTRNPEFKQHKWAILEDAQKYWNRNLELFCFLYDSLFGLLWQQMDDYRQTQYDIRERLINPALPMFSKVGKRKKKKVKRVAYLTAQMHVNGPYANTRTLMSFLEGHEGQEVYVYNYGGIDPALVIKCHQYRQFNGSYQERIEGIMQACEDDQIDVLISDMYWSIPLVLFQMRAAPRQYYLSMGFQKFPCDKVILMDTMEPFDEDCHQVPYTLRKDFLFREEPVIESVADFGTLGRLEKASPEFVETVKTIEERSGDRFAMWGAGTNPGLTVYPPSSPHAVLPTLKVFLDPFPLCGCMAAFEAQAHGVPVVTLHNPSLGSYDKHKPLVVDTKDAYINAVCELLTDEVARKRVGLEGQERVKAMTDTRRGAKAIEALWN